jgi:DNA-binding transcriptional LysR family regulator
MFVEKPFKVPFRLGLVKGLGVQRMSSLLKRFTASTETMELTLVPSEEHCDARIISKELLVSAEQFVPMWQESYLLAMPIDHPLCLQDHVELSDLSKLAFIQRSPCEGWNFLREQLQFAAIDLDIRARIQTIEYAIGLVKAGLGCAFIPVSQDTAKHQELIFRSITDLNLTRQIGLAYKQDSQLIKSLINSLQLK